MNDFETQAKADALDMLKSLGGEDTQYTPNGGSAATITMLIETGVELETAGESGYVTNGITGHARKADMPSLKIDEAVTRGSDNYRIAQPLEDDGIFVTVQLLPVA